MGRPTLGPTARNRTMTVRVTEAEEAWIKAQGGLRAHLDRTTPTTLPDKPPRHPGGLITTPTTTILVAGEQVTALRDGIIATNEGDITMKDGHRVYNEPPPPPPPPPEVSVRTVLGTGDDPPRHRHRPSDIVVAERTEKGTRQVQYACVECGEPLNWRKP